MQFAERQLQDELSTLQYHINRKIKPFLHLLNQKGGLDRGQLYRRCAITYDSLYDIPKGFPSQLYIANIPQQATFYSAYSKTVLLCSKNFTGKLLTERDERVLKTPLFRAKKDIDALTILEHKIELLKYLDSILKEPKKLQIKEVKTASKEVKEETILSHLKNHEERLLRLERRMDESKRR